MATNFALKVNQQQMQNSEGMDKDNWPDFSDTHFSESTNEYYQRRSSF